MHISNTVLRCTFVLLFLTVLLSNPALAKKTTQVAKAPITMSDYIELHCKSKCAEQEELLQAVWDASSVYDVDPVMLLAIVKVESGFKPAAKSGSNIGLMQVHLRWHRFKFEGIKPTDIQANVLVGAFIYRGYLDKEKGNTARALKRYNGFGDSRYVTKVEKARGEISRLVDLKRQVTPLEEEDSATSQVKVRNT